MMKNSKDQIIFPFLIVGDPIAQRIAFPIIEISWIFGAALALALSFAIVGFSLINADDIGPMLMLGFLFLSVVFLLFYAANLAIKRLLYDILIIESDKIIHYSKLKSSKKEFYINKIDEIVLEKYHGNHAIVVINEKKGSQVLIDKVVILYGMRKLERFIEELGNRTSLKVCSLVHE